MYAHSGRLLQFAPYASLKKPLLGEKLIAFPLTHVE